MPTLPPRLSGNGMDAFDPELRTLARFLPRCPVRPRTVGPLRYLMGLLDRRQPADVEVHRVGSVSVRLHRPGSDADSRLIEAGRPAILWIHGGGYVIGNAAQDDDLCRRMANRHGAVVAAVDYRLAPEHPFPVPLDDCHDALVWLAALDGVDADRVAIAGASAGGGLAAGLAIAARDRGAVTPVFQLLIYPMVDDRTVHRSDIDERHFRLWDNTGNRFGWASYTGRPAGSNDIADAAVPARAADVGGLAPAWIGVGTLDLFHDEDLAYAERLRGAGVDCEVHEAPGAFHGFDGLAPKARVTRDFIASQDAALDRAFGR